MATKIFEEVNLVNYQITDGVPASDNLNNLVITPVYVGSEFTQNMSGFRIITGDDPGGYFLRAAFSSGPMGRSVSANLNLEQIPIIPTDSIITAVRFSIDYTLSFSIEAGVSSGNVGAQLGPNGLGGFPPFAPIIQISNGFGINLILPLTGVNNSCPGIEQILTQSNSVTDSFEVEVPFEEPLDYNTFLLLFETVNINLVANVEATATQCDGGVITKTIEISFEIDISNWRFEVDYQDGGSNIQASGGAGENPEFEDDIEGGIELGNVDAPDEDIQLLENQFVEASGGVQDEDLDYDNANFLVSITGGMELGGDPNIVMSVDPSGIYTLVPGQRFDRIYTRNVDPDDTEDVAIPTPFVKTGFLGE